MLSALEHQRVLSVVERQKFARAERDRSFANLVKTRVDLFIDKAKNGTDFTATSGRLGRVDSVLVRDLDGRIIAFKRTVDGRLLESALYGEGVWVSVLGGVSRVSHQDGRRKKPLSQMNEAELSGVRLNLYHPETYISIKQRFG